MSKREKFISAKAAEIYANVIEDSIRLGLDNADNEELKEVEYSIVEEHFKYGVFDDKGVLLSNVWYDPELNISREQAYKAAQAIVKSLQEGEE